MNLVPHCGLGFWVGVGVRCVYCRRGTFTAGDAFSTPFSCVLPKGAFCTDGLTEKRTLRVGLTKRRILRWRRHRDVTKRRILHRRSHGKAHFACGPHQKAHSACGRWRRVRLSVRVRAQNALFRRMCFSLPAQTSGDLTENRTLDRHLTEKRTLHPSSHGKPHSVPATPRKSAFCAGDATST